LSRYSFSGEDALRRRWHNPERLLRKIGLGPGMVFMDIGCGYGFFTIPAAQILDKQGKVYAVDVNSSAVEKLKRKASEEELENIITAVGEAEKTIFCEKCADIVFFSIVLHDFKNPPKVLQNAKRMIKPNGILINLDWKKKPTGFGPPTRIRFSAEEAQTMIKRAGFTIESNKDVGSNFYLIKARP
jgi:ubiquinone/menaquinone biosynthesis C-methylase UbiE